MCSGVKAGGLSLIIRDKLKVRAMLKKTRLQLTLLLMEDKQNHEKGVLLQGVLFEIG